ncbi:MAG: bifunctional 4-hydroxy-2-oxoglutarate aldolase/2-dehydro-3-deoxy-phosphogluconate aldolase [Kiritimatiellae bacterium]|nr:bifunctional 4-hydroxy-2-oxoglutarate aldolase/2-dehydro-3-deoxy-phosphogluconate aldolase [Kiritimatiellia bacterium]
MCIRDRHGPPLARALMEGGVGAMELTLRTPAALDALRRIRAEVPEMLAGVGTILTPDQVEAARSAGAAFGVSPGTNPRVLEAAARSGLPFAPGVATPSDIERALEHGCQVLKLFPAEPLGGIAYLRAIAAPYQHLGVRFVPLGGLTQGNVAQWLAEPLVLAVGGSWLAPRDAIRNGDWAAIRALAEAARTAVVQTRQAQANGTGRGPAPQR